MRVSCCSLTSGGADGAGVDEGACDGDVVVEALKDGTAVVPACGGVDDVDVNVGVDAGVDDGADGPDAVVDGSALRLSSSRCICFLGAVGVPLKGKEDIFPAL